MALKNVDFSDEYEQKRHTCLLQELKDAADMLEKNLDVREENEKKLFETESIMGELKLKLSEKMKIPKIKKPSKKDELGNIDLKLKTLSYKEQFFVMKHRVNNLEKMNTQLSEKHTKTLVTLKTTENALKQEKENVFTCQNLSTVHGSIENMNNGGIKKGISKKTLSTNINKISADKTTDHTASSLFRRSDMSKGVLSEKNGQNHQFTIIDDKKLRMNQYCKWDDKFKEFVNAGPFDKSINDNTQASESMDILDGNRGKSKIMSVAEMIEWCKGCVKPIDNISESSNERTMSNLDSTDRTGKTPFFMIDADKKIHNKRLSFDCAEEADLEEESMQNYFTNMEFTRKNNQDSEESYNLEQIMFQDKASLFLNEKSYEKIADKYNQKANPKFEEISKPKSELIPKIQ